MLHHSCMRKMLAEFNLTVLASTAKFNLLPIFLVIRMDLLAGVVGESFFSRMELLVGVVGESFRRMDLLVGVVGESFRVAIYIQA